MNIDEKKKSVIWEEIIQEAQEMFLPLQEDEMTVNMFRDSTFPKLEYRTAREHLEMKVKSGILTKRFAIVDGHRTAIYCPASPE